MMRLHLTAAWVGVQLLFFVGWTTREHMRATTGASILVRVVPVDPRDLLRGQYLNLGYEFSRSWNAAAVRPPTPNDAVWVVLRPEGGLYVPVSASLTRPTALDSSEVVILGRVQRGIYVFGIEQYFVPEGTETPAVSDLTVRLRVAATGIARIEQVYVRGVPWPSVRSP
jgi:uncharacterized membrane-anchored protein